MKGGHKQETREGYNLLKVEKETTTINGITFTINKDGCVTCNGTATATTTLYFASANNSIYPKEIDTGKYKIVGGTTNAMLGCQIGSTYYNTNSNRIIELTEQSSISNAYLQIASGTTVNNETIYPLLYKYDNVEKKYEQYGISPSLEYSSKIETVGSNINLFNYNDKKNVNALYSTDEKGWISCQVDNSAGTSIQYLNYYTNNLDLNKNSQYAVFLEVENVSGKGYISLVSNDTNAQSSNYYNLDFDNLKNNKTYKTVITTKSEFSEQGNGLRTYCGFKPGQSGAIKFRIAVLENIDITAEEFVYSNYNQGSVKIDITNRNLLDFNVSQDSKVTVNDDGTVTINGSGAFSLKFKEMTFKANKTYKAKAVIVSGTYTSSDVNHIGIMTPFRWRRMV